MPAFLFLDTLCQSIEGDIQQAGFGTGLECTAFAYRQVGACRDFDLFDPAESVADFEHQIGFVFGFDRAAELVDGGVGFVGAEAGEVAAGGGVDAGGQLSALLQDFAAARIGRPFLTAPAFGFEVVFGDAEQFGGNGLHHRARVAGVAQQLAEAALQVAVVQADFQHRHPFNRLITQASWAALSDGNKTRRRRCV